MQSLEFKKTLLQEVIKRITRTLKEKVEKAYWVDDGFIKYSGEYIKTPEAEKQHKNKNYGGGAEELSIIKVKVKFKKKCSQIYKKRV